MTKLEGIIKAIRVSIDSTNEEETDLIADLNTALELLTRYNREEIAQMSEALRWIDQATTTSAWVGRAGDFLGDLLSERERV